MRNAPRTESADEGVVLLAVALASLPAAAAAQQSELRGKVRSGREVTIATGETVQGDLIASAGTVRIEGRVGEDVLLGAGQATVAPGAQIGGDLIFGAGRMQMDGAVAGSVLGSTGNYARGGSVGGSERVNVGQPAEERSPRWRIARLTPCGGT
jgi:hypothetical protein